MKNKLLSFVLAGIVILPCFTLFFACKPKTEMYSAPQKKADYLYSMTFNDYVFDTEEKTIKSNGQASGGFGCSSVRKDNFYGRNFDFIFNDVPEFIVRVNKNEKIKHSSIGVATHFGLRESQMTTYGYDELSLIPNFTLDGINDAGVVCSHNVVEIEAGHEIPVAGTKASDPTAQKLHMLFIPRFVLDNASTASEAVELIKSCNVYGKLETNYPNMPEPKAEYLHIMIADANKTYVVEFFDDGQGNYVHVYEKIEDDQVMTNFYLGIPMENLNYVHGLERYNILKENYNKNVPATRGSMQQLLRLVQYSKAYDITLEHPWRSESLTRAQLDTISETAFKSTPEAIQLANDYKYAIQNNVRYPANANFWHTTHNSTYDMANKKLYVYVQEDYSQYFTVTL